MVTIPVQLSDELAERLVPVKDRLPEIIELGLRQLELEELGEVLDDQPALRDVLLALDSTGIVTLPDRSRAIRSQDRHSPVQASGQPASEIILEERRGQK
jgi:hypothetical protein